MVKTYIIGKIFSQVLDFRVKRSKNKARTNVPYRTSTVPMVPYREPKCTMYGTVIINCSFYTLTDNKF